MGQTLKDPHKKGVSFHSVLKPGEVDKFLDVPSSPEGGCLKGKKGKKKGKKKKSCQRPAVRW